MVFCTLWILRGSLSEDSEVEERYDPGTAAGLGKTERKKQLAHIIYTVAFIAGLTYQKGKHAYCISIYQYECMSIYIYIFIYKPAYTATIVFFG